MQNINIQSTSKREGIRRGWKCTLGMVERNMEEKANKIFQLNLSA
jgi:hypothetical protein